MPIVEYPFKKKEFGKDRCDICGYVLNDDSFPDDFPKEWMFCCYCKIIAEAIVEKRLVNKYTTDSFYTKIIDKIIIVKKL